jgi:hypothetical protein
VDECADLDAEIERLRSYLVDLTAEVENFLHADVLQASRELDERIAKFYKMKKANNGSGVKIA